MGIADAARCGLVAVALVLIAPAASAADQETLYLGTDGFPHATLVGNPLGGELPNFDRGRDIEPGLLLERSSLGLEETDEARYQHWQVSAGGRILQGYPAIVIWSAPAGFDAGAGAAFTVYLLDCNSSASDCIPIGSADARIEPGFGSEWVESVLLFDQVDHEFQNWRYLGVRVVVSASSASDVMFAYGYPKQRSRLTIYDDPQAAPISATADTASVSTSAELKEKLRRASEPTLSLVSEPEQPEAEWAWVLTLATSTILLVGLGGVLLAGLTKPGRHERKPGRHQRTSVPIEPSREDRVPASVR